MRKSSENDKRNGEDPITRIYSRGSETRIDWKVCTTRPNLLLDHSKTSTDRRYAYARSCLSIGNS